MDTVHVVQQYWENNDGIRVFQRKEDAMKYFEHYYWLYYDKGATDSFEKFKKAKNTGYFEYYSNDYKYCVCYKEVGLQKDGFVLGWD